MRKQKKWQYLLMAVPGLLFVIIFIFIPLINGTRIALFSWNGYGKTMKYVGLDNFVALFSDKRLPRTTINTLIYGLGSCLLQNIFGLLLAIFVNRKFKARNAVRAIVYMPIMVSGFIFGEIMHIMFSYDNGVINDILSILGQEPVYWLGNSWTGVLIITIVNSWQYVGLCMLIYLAGLQAIPSTYIEAASIDGANAIVSFFKIKLPLLVPSIVTAVITNLIGGLKLYDVVIGLTEGGPNRETMSLSQYIQLLYFNDEKAGYSAAVGIYMFVLICVLSLPLNKLLKSKEVQA